MKPTIERIAKATADICGVNVAALLSQEIRKPRDIIQHRHLAMYLCGARFGYQHRHIAAAFQFKASSKNAVCHAIANVRSQMHINPHLAELAQEICEALGAPVGNEIADALKDPDEVCKDARFGPIKKFSAEWFAENDRRFRAGFIAALYAARAERITAGE